MSESAVIQIQCCVCGSNGHKEEEKGSIREAYRCANCRSPLRTRDQAAAIVRVMGRGRYVCLRDLIKDETFQTKAVYEVALHSPFIRFFRHLPNYVQSYLWPDVPLGEVKDGIRSEDLTKLTFQDHTFDLIVSTDVMNHVMLLDRAFAEIFRILKPGGYHVFTVPLNWPLPAKTVRRASDKNGMITHHLPPKFSKAADGTPSLVCSEFGYDILDTLESNGYEAWFDRPSISSFPAYRHALVVAKKPARSMACNLQSADAARLVTAEAPPMVSPSSP